MAIFAILFVKLSSQKDQFTTLSKSSQLAAELRQSSDDLTRMVRSYVATGNLRYKRQFDEILTIRDGISRRPDYMDKVYWDLVLDDNIRPSDYGEPAALLDLMRKEGFTANEFALLELAKANSDTLTQIEYQAMAMIESDNSDEIRIKAIKSLFDQNYMAAKAGIMLPIREFEFAVENRLSDQLYNLQSTTQNYLYGFIVSMILTLISIFRIISSHRVEAKRLVSVVEGKQKQLQQALDDAHQLTKIKDQFMTNMSHEIRTPMNGIYGTLQLLQSEQLTPSQNELVEKALFSNKALLTIINDILDISKIEANKIVLDQTDFDIIELVDSCVAELQSMADSKNIKLILQDNLDQQHIRFGDPTRVRQILLNLISNAVKFTKTGSVTINLDIDSNSEDVVFYIVDTGIGMSTEQLDRLFDRFTQADSSTTREFGGTGLGMAITKSLIDLMTGKIFVQSVEGEGSEFTVTLPLSIGSKTNYDESKKSVNSIPNFSNRTILFAEDNAVNTLILKKMLEKTGATIIHVSNGQEAVDQAIKSKPDVLIMDIQMPVMDGLTACINLRDDGYKKPIIALTANVFKEDIETYYESGFNSVVAKPVEQRKLFSKLNEQIANSSK
ncbi:MAG: ATP-binding protein [Kangiellaceae bacterium]|jgi:signal transduction histidine kinase/CheY-like chemotaxis protein|nr:ATP-binding protein [Kangiellaceae bacterium]